jgi:5'-nucleotidase
MGIPSIAVSGVSTSQVSYTTLTSDPTSKASLAAEIYSVLSVAFIEKLFANSTSLILPAGTLLNINYPATDNCVDVSNFRFVLSRVEWDPFSTDVHTCGSNHLPTETLVHSTSGCYVSVSVVDAKIKVDVNAATQRVVLNKLSGLFTCIPEASELLFHLQ